MNARMVCLMVICVPVIILSAGCGSMDQPPVPVTGADVVPVPAAVQTARSTVLEFATTSSRLRGTLVTLEWKLEEVQYEGEYRYRSGAWLMVIWPAQDAQENQRVVIMNKNENAYWSGYVRPDGEVVDTSFEP